MTDIEIFIMLLSIPIIVFLSVYIILVIERIKDPSLRNYRIKIYTDDKGKKCYLTQYQNKFGFWKDSLDFDNYMDASDWLRSVKEVLMRKSKSVEYRYI